MCLRPGGAGPSSPFHALAPDEAAGLDGDAGRLGGWGGWEAIPRQTWEARAPGQQCWEGSRPVSAGIPPPPPAGTRQASADNIGSCPQHPGSLLSPDKNEQVPTEAHCHSPQRGAALASASWSAPDTRREAGDSASFPALPASGPRLLPGSRDFLCSVFKNQTNQLPSLNNTRKSRPLGWSKRLREPGGGDGGTSGRRTGRAADGLLAWGTGSPCPSRDQGPAERAGGREGWRQTGPAQACVRPQPSVTQGGAEGGCD